MITPSRELRFAIDIIKRAPVVSASVIADAAMEIPGVHSVSVHPESDNQAWLHLGYPIGVDIDTSNENALSVTFHEHDTVRYRKTHEGEITGDNIEEVVTMMLGAVEQIASDYAPMHWIS